MVIDDKTQVQDWENLGRMSKLFRESDGRRRSEIITEMAKYLSLYRVKYNEVYNPLRKPNGKY